MTPEDVTDVTGNKQRRSVPPELKLLIDFAASAALLYYATHPDCLDGISDRLRAYRDRAAHKMSVWATWWSIRSLPETDQ